VTVALSDREGGPLSPWRWPYSIGILIGFRFIVFLLGLGPWWWVYLVTSYLPITNLCLLSCTTQLYAYFAH